MTLTESWLLSLVPIAALSLFGWLWSVARRNVDIVDSLWSVFFVLAVTSFWFRLEESHFRAVLATALLVIWAVRLCAHITWRNFGAAEDRRYRSMRKKHGPAFSWKSLYIVFGPQALLAWLLAVPLLIAVRVPAALTLTDAAAVLLWCAGFCFEAVGDWQLQRFRRDPANADRVLQSGLWRYTRHPNYFGEACMWWAFWLFAIPGGGWWTVFSPALMTVLLLRVSGVTLLERDIDERRPEYASYVRRTNAFFPGPPKGEAA